MSVDLNQLEEQLNTLPHKIREQELKMIEAEHKVEELKLKYDVEYGMALLASEKPNATEKKAEAVIRSNTQKAELLEGEYNLSKEKAGLNYLENRFIAIRKISSIENELLKSQLSGN